MGLQLFDVSGTDLLDPVQGGVNGMLAEMDRNATVERLAAGKRRAREKGRRVEGRWPYGEHPAHKRIDADGKEVDYDKERAVVARIRQMSAEGVSS